MNASAARIRCAAGILLTWGTGLGPLGCEALQRPTLSAWVMRDTPDAVHGDGIDEIVVDGVQHFARISLGAARNETACFRLALRSGGQAVSGLQWRASPFGDPAGREVPVRLELYRLHAVEVTHWPGWHIRAVPPNRREPAPLDVLVPLAAPVGGWPDHLDPEQTVCFWADVTVPPETAPGRYHAAVGISGRGVAPVTLHVQLEVYPFTLPELTTPWLVADLDHRALFEHHAGSAEPGAESGSSPPAETLRRVVWDTQRLLEAHRVVGVLPEYAPAARINAVGGVGMDWADYDALVEPVLGGTLSAGRPRVPAWPLPLGPMLTAWLRSDALPAPGRAEVLEDYVRQCAAHFAGKGWLTRSYAVLPEGLVESPALRERGSELARRLHDADEGVRVLARWFPQDLRPYGWADYVPLVGDAAVDIWAPPAQFYDPQVMQQERSAGRRTWVGVDRPPFSGSVAIQARAVDSWVLTWQALALGAEAVRLGCVNRWPAAGRGGPGEGSPSASLCALADPNVLIYPGLPFGLDAPVASVRLKHLRRAAQDAAYLNLLGNHGLGHIRGTLVQSLSPYAGTEAYCTHYADGRAPGWPDDPALFQVARRIMVEALLEAVLAPAGGGGAEAFTRRTSWRRLMLATRRFRVEPNGVRIRLAGGAYTPEAGSPPARLAEIECALALSNHARVPTGGILQLADLPDVWEADPAERTIDPLAPGSARRTTLKATTPGLHCSLGGHLWLPVDWAADDGGHERVHARLSYVAATRTDRPPTIDGDLADWPVGTVNTAGDFTLVSGGYTGPQDWSVARPGGQTTAFVLRDGRNLYLAVNCAGAASPVPGGERRKAVAYDDLVPAGEDLVEILLDPLNAGTRSPSDLYRVVVKREGFDILEKGLRTVPPVGRSAPWAADVRVATREAADGWTAEIQIPLAAVDPGAADAASAAGAAGADDGARAAGATGATAVIWGFNIARFDASRQEFSTWSGAAHNAYDPLTLGNLLLP
ncbi:MAG TPA: DUF4091 domain-containing protein [Phycisphaerae bacterium]|nr:DUF4091 domain-containing protein [Phycisphaerae bacterium]HNU46762.1 DUF4091 domain-containing protein [Phycisphaerae bacterium]